MTMATEGDASKLARIRAWIDAAKTLVKDPSALVTCPNCGEANLVVRDMIGERVMERELRCPSCGIANYVLNPDLAPDP